MLSNISASVLQEDHRKKEYSCLSVPHIQCLHLMYSEVVWILESLGTQVQPQIILNPDCLPENYLSISFDYVLINNVNSFQKTFVSETGLFDFHKLIGRMIKSHIPKQKPNILIKTSYPNATKKHFKLMNLKNYLLLH